MLWNLSHIVTAVYFFYFVINILGIFLPGKIYQKHWFTVHLKKILLCIVCDSFKKKLLCSDSTTIIQKWKKKQSKSCTRACIQEWAIVLCSAWWKQRALSTFYRIRIKTKDVSYEPCNHFTVTRSKKEEGCFARKHPSLEWKGIIFSTLPSNKHCSFS